MEFVKEVLTHSFFWGFVLGMVFCVLALIGQWKTRRELKRYQRHLSDKLEIEAEHVASVRKELETLKKENENLRVRNSSGSMSNSAQALERELEIFARAEKTMVVKAPGFAQAWESAKDAAHAEIEEEERGKSLPRRIFRKFFASGSHGGGGGDSHKMLETRESPEQEEPAEREEKGEKAGAGSE